MRDLPLLSVLDHETHRPPPVWLMRQAGRYLPEYRALRTEAGSFLELCYDPKRASEATLQPIRRFGLDAAILFSDILVIPHALGQELNFAEGEGPRLPPLQQLPTFDPVTFARHLQPVYDALAETRTRLPAGTALLGFAGAPWTLAAYMLDGQGGNFPRAREMLAREAWGLAQLIDLLVEAIVEHLALQVAAGADAVQLFDSWAGLLSPAQAMEWCLAPTLRILAGFAARCPGVPMILFPRAVAPDVLLALAEDGRAAALSLATGVDPAWARQHLQSRVAVQGNLDPLVLVEGGVALEEAVARLRQELGDGPWICNLGHGVLPHTPPEHVARLVELVRQ